MSDGQDRGNWDEPTRAVPNVGEQAGRQGPPPPPYGNPQHQQPYGTPQQYGGQPGYQQQPQQYGPPGYQQQYGPPGYQNQQYPPQGFNQPPYGQPQQPRTGGLGAVLGWVVAAFAVLAIVGCFGPWASIHLTALGVGEFHATINGFGQQSSNIPGDSGSGSDTKDGWYVLVAAVIVIVLAVLRGLKRLPKPALLGATVLGLVVTGIGVYDWSDISDKAGDLKRQAGTSGAALSAGTGWGLWLVVVGGVGILAATIWSALKD